jgi:hypothetical protein
MCCSRANLVCSDFTRAPLEIRSSRWYSAFGEVPIFRCSSFTASENASVDLWYSIASRVFSSQLITAEQHITFIPTVLRMAQYDQSSHQGTVASQNADLCIVPSTTGCDGFTRQRYAIGVKLS